jgi:hypothetical protein
MKKNYFKMLFLIFVINLLSAPLLFAQGAYLNINSGYATSMSTQNLSGFENYTFDSYSMKSEQINFSFGKGLNFGADFGYMFNKNLGAEIGVSYLIGGNTISTRTQPNYTSEMTISSKMLRINPSLVITSGFEKINPYAKFGLILGSGYVISSSNQESSGFSGQQSSYQSFKLSGGIAIGLTSGIGALYKINDKLSFFGELNMINLSYAPTKGIKTDFRIDGVDMLPSLTTRQKETEYLDSFTLTSSNSNPPTSEPSKELKQKLPFGSFGLNLGLRVNF